MTRFEDNYFDLHGIAVSYTTNSGTNLVQKHNMFTQGLEVNEQNFRVDAINDIKEYLLKEIQTNNNGIIVNTKNSEFEINAEVINIANGLDDLKKRINIERNENIYDCYMYVADKVKKNNKDSLYQEIREEYKRISDSKYSEKINKDIEEIKGILTKNRNITTENGEISSLFTIIENEKFSEEEISGIIEFLKFKITKGEFKLYDEEKVILNNNKNIFNCCNYLLNRIGSIEKDWENELEFIMDKADSYSDFGEDKDVLDFVTSESDRLYSVNPDKPGYHDECINIIMKMLRFNNKKDINSYYEKERKNLFEKSKKSYEEYKRYKKDNESFSEYLDRKTDNLGLLSIKGVFEEIVRQTIGINKTKLKAVDEYRVLTDEATWQKFLLKDRNNKDVIYLTNASLKSNLKPSVLIPSGKQDIIRYRLDENELFKTNRKLAEEILECSKGLVTNREIGTLHTAERIPREVYIKTISNSKNNIPFYVTPNIEIIGDKHQYEISRKLNVHYINGGVQVFGFAKTITKRDIEDLIMKKECKRNLIDIDIDEINVAGDGTIIVDYVRSGEAKQMIINDFCVKKWGDDLEEDKFTPGITYQMCTFSSQTFNYENSNGMLISAPKAKTASEAEKSEIYNAVSEFMRMFGVKANIKESAILIEENANNIINNENIINATRGKTVEALNNRVRLILGTIIESENELRIHNYTSNNYNNISNILSRIYTRKTANEYHDLKCFVDLIKYDIDSLKNITREINDIIKNSTLTYEEVYDMFNTKVNQISDEKFNFVNACNLLHLEIFQVKDY